MSRDAAANIPSEGKTEYIFDRFAVRGYMCLLRRNKLHAIPTQYRKKAKLCRVKAKKLESDKTFQSEETLRQSKEKYKLEHSQFADEKADFLEQIDRHFKRKEYLNKLSERMRTIRLQMNEAREEKLALDQAIFFLTEKIEAMHRKMHRLEYSSSRTTGIRHRKLERWQNRKIFLKGHLYKLEDQLEKHKDDLHGLKILHEKANKKREEKSLKPEDIKKRMTELTKKSEILKENSHLVSSQERKQAKAVKLRKRASSYNHAAETVDKIVKHFGTQVPDDRSSLNEYVTRLHQTLPRTGMKSLSWKVTRQHKHTQHSSETTSTGLRSTEHWNVTVESSVTQKTAKPPQSDWNIMPVGRAMPRYTAKCDRLDTWTVARFVPTDCTTARNTRTSSRLCVIM